jgi:hypothetical protein
MMVALHAWWGIDIINLQLQQKGSPPANPSPYCIIMTRRTRIYACCASGNWISFRVVQLYCHVVSSSLDLLSIINRPSDSRSISYHIISYLKHQNIKAQAKSRRRLASGRVLPTALRPPPSSLWTINTNRLRFPLFGHFFDPLLTTRYLFGNQPGAEGTASFKL